MQNIIITNQDPILHSRLIPKQEGIIYMKTYFKVC